jgi:hypothetical protein
MKTPSVRKVRSLRARAIAGLTFVTLAAVPFVGATTPAEDAARAGDKAAGQAADKIADYREEKSDVTKAQAQAAFAQIDAELAHLDALADHAPTEAQKIEARARYDALRERRNALKKEWNQARFDTFKADVKQEVDRVSVWAKDTFSNRPASASASASANASANNASDKIADYRGHPNTATKAEVKASLARLDADIAQLEVRVDAIADAERKAQHKQKLKALKERRSDLNKEFLQARFDALSADVKSEWNQLTN